MLQQIFPTTNHPCDSSRSFSRQPAYCGGPDVESQLKYWTKPLVSMHDHVSNDVSFRAWRFVYCSPLTEVYESSQQNWNEMLINLKVMSR